MNKSFFKIEVKNAYGFIQEEEYADDWKELLKLARYYREKYGTLNYHLCMERIYYNGKYI